MSACKVSLLILLILGIGVGIAYVVIKVFALKKLECTTCHGITNNLIECKGRVGSCLQLECPSESPKGEWFLKSSDNNKSISIGKTNSETKLKDFSIEKESLQIKKLSLAHFGSNRYLFMNNDEWCSYGIFVYDLSPKNGVFSVNGVSQDVKSSKPMIIQIDSFENGLNVSYELHGLPLDNLKIDNERVKTKDCTRKGSSLRCLKTGVFQYDLQRCVDRYEINLSYEFDSFPPFTNDTELTPKNFIKEIYLEYSPKVHYPVVDYAYNSPNEKVLLKCEVECGQPKDFIYSWSLGKKVIATTKIDTLRYRIDASSNENQIEITCTVTNKLKTSKLTESQTKFILKPSYQPDYLNKSFLTKMERILPIWAWIVLCIVEFLMIAALVIFFVVYYLRKKKKYELANLDDQDNDKRLNF